MTGGKPKAARAPSDMDLRVSARLRERRLASGMTLVELAGCLGVSHQQLQKYETGANRISAGMLYEVARRLNVPLADFFACAGPAEDDQLLRRRREAHQIVDAITDAQLEAAVRNLKALGG